MLGKPGELRVWTGAGEDLGVSFCDDSPALAFERLRATNLPSLHL